MNEENGINEENEEIEINPDKEINEETTDSKQETINEKNEEKKEEPEDKKLLREFSTTFSELPENYKTIVTNTIGYMEKNHKMQTVKKEINLKQLIKHYRKLNDDMSENELLDKCAELDDCFNEETYKSIVKRNLVKLKDNPTMQTVAQVLGIPFDENGIPYIDKGSKNEKKKLNKSLNEKLIPERIYTLTDEYIKYSNEFQIIGIKESFKLLSINDMRAITYLVKALKENILAPELFYHTEEDF